jgi:hypothetical protein
MKAICDGHGRTASPFPRRRPRVRAQEDEKGNKNREKGGDVATDERVPQVSDSNERLSLRAVWRCAGWVAPWPKEEAGRVGRLEAQEGMKGFSY